jgi:SagB-type dehydrogenase family enzyme
MDNRTTHVAQTYADAIFDRVARPIEPPGFKPNWGDQPLRHTIYPGAEQLALPELLAPPHPFADALNRLGAHNPRSQLSVAALASCLRLSLGGLSRRLTITWNGENAARTHYHQAMYGRGAASGGGLYPTEVYLAAGPSGPLAPGIYHYAGGRHSIERLAVGDPTAAVHAALLDHPDAVRADQFLLVSVNFWKNAYKYNNFSYHVVTQDTGAFLGAFRLLAAGFGADLGTLLWFHDEGINRILGLDTTAESVLAAIPFHVANGKSAAGLGLDTTPAPTILHRPFQRSRTIVRFPMVEETHQSTLIVDEPHPTPDAVLDALTPRPRTGRERVALPLPERSRLEASLTDVFVRRNSSFGRFSPQTALTMEELATLLAAGAAAHRAPTDVTGASDGAILTQLMVFINHVQGIQPGIYAYDKRRHDLELVRAGDHTQFLQRSYFLHNYNVAHAGAVIVMTGRVGPALRAYGNRGLRILNIEIGATVQTLYLTGTALGLGCGAALGFDNAMVTQALGLDRNDERAMLWFMVGHEREIQPSFDDRLI